MCRFVAYFGNQKIALSDVLQKPENSLIKQSRHAVKDSHIVNADGFGIAWYDFDIDNSPGIFKSIKPAWNDNNLINIAKKIKSSCFLAHVRAATTGNVSENNCHPFEFNKYVLVHNGMIKNFDCYKRDLLNKLNDEMFLAIKGNTDSEYLFLLIMHFTKENGNDLQIGVKKAINWITELQTNEDNDIFSKLNIVITNGEEFIATRFSSKNQELSLNYHISSKNNRIESLILSSEPLEDSGIYSWNDVPENSLLYINKKNMQLVIEKI